MRRKDGLRSWKTVLGGAVLAASALIAAAPDAARGDIAPGTFEDQNPGTDTFRSDFRPANEFTTGDFSLNNNFDPTFNVWTGFAVSSRIDYTFDPLDFDFIHQYGAYAPLGANGTGAGGSATYGIAFNFAQGDAIINLPSALDAYSIDVTNTTYVAQAITLGDGFARAFHQNDYFLLTTLGFSGLNGTGSQIGSVPFYLADFRGPSLQLVSNWTTVSLSSLQGARSLEFTLTSTDVGTFGMNTPAYFALDNLTALAVVPEPTSWLVLGLGLVALSLLPGHRAAVRRLR